MDWQAAGLEQVKRWKCFGGEQWVFAHRSTSTGTRMEFGLYHPPPSAGQPRGVLMFLSGLACTWENATTKAGLQRAAAEHGLVIVTPDTSPRGEEVPDDAAYDLGKGAGFYVDATQAPWSTHFHMYNYVANELPDLITRVVGVHRFGLTGHSMGGHGALTIALKNPQRFHSLSAFAPIVAPTRVPWGQKAFTAYLGDSRSWAAYDSCALMSTHGFPRDILIDQGEADEFLQSQLRPDAFVEACGERRVSVSLRMQPGYDHSYYFVATFAADHVRWHAERLTAPKS